MSSKIKIYKGAVTAGQTDGTLVSSGTGLDPIESGAIKVPESGYAEGNWIKLAVRCDPGYETVEDSSRHARISIIDSTKVTMWQLAPDNNGQAGTAEDWGRAAGFLNKNRCNKYNLLGQSKRWRIRKNRRMMKVWIFRLRQRIGATS